MTLTVEIGSVERLSKWPTVAELRDWHGFLFQSREFLQIWLETIGVGRGSECCLVFVRDGDGVPVLLLPLCIEKRYGVRLIRFMDGGVSDYNGPLLRRDRPLRVSWDDLWEAIRAKLPQVDGFELRKIAPFSGLAANPMMALPDLVEVATGSLVRPTGSWNDYLSLPSRRRHHRGTKRALAKLGRRAEVSFVRATEPRLATEILGFIEGHKRAQYRRTIGFDNFDMPGYAAFFQRMCSAPALAAIADVSCLKAGGQLIAGHLGYRDPYRLYYILPTYDPEWSAAGRVHCEMLIEECFHGAQRIFDFGEGGEGYKRTWATETYALYGYSSARSLRGRAALWMNAERHALLSRRKEQAAAAA